MLYKGYTLDRFQEEAIDAISCGHSVIVAAPTGAGKTVIAEYAVEKCIEQDKRVIYTAPIKALSNQKYRDFHTDYGELIGIMTGDIVLNPDAPALIMTTEIFRNTIFENIERVSDVEYVIFDEIHYINDIQRGTVWEESIIFAPQNIKFVCLSATMPNLRQFASWMQSVREIQIDMVEETNRPVPLERRLYFEGYGIGDLPALKKIQGMIERERALQRQFIRGDWDNEKWEEWENFDDEVEEIDLDKLNVIQTDLIDYLKWNKQLPCLYFCFSRQGCEKKSLAYSRESFLNGAQRTKILTLYDELCERYNIQSDENVKNFKKLVANGVAYHHAGMLPTLKEVVERLFTSGLLQLLFTTETFSVGINMPACTAVFDSLEKFDGTGFRYLKTREYHQMAGRAGRRGIDTIGYVYAKVHPRFADSDEVKRIVSGRLEPIESQFNLSYSSLLNLYDKYGEDIYDVCAVSLSNYQTTELIRRLEQKISALEQKLQEMPKPECIHPNADAQRECETFAAIGQRIERERQALKPQKNEIKRKYKGKKNRRIRQTKLTKLDGQIEKFEEKRKAARCYSCQKAKTCKGQMRDVKNCKQNIETLQKQRESAATYQRAKISTRLKLLERLGYMDKSELLPRGKVAMQIYGYEMQITQLLFAGCLEDLNEDYLNVLAMAIVHESKPDEAGKKLKDKSLTKILLNASKEINRIQVIEERCKVDELTPSMNAKLSSAMLAWSQGCEFDELQKYTNLSDGDLVRTFRSAIDLLRQTRRASVDHPALRDKLLRCIMKINRDVVDAERQLRAIGRIKVGELIEY